MQFNWYGMYRGVATEERTRWFMDIESTGLARGIGKQILGKSILCPLCLSRNEQHRLFPIPFEEDVLMCPRCEMQVNLVIYRQRVYEDEVLESNARHA